MEYNEIFKSSKPLLDWSSEFDLAGFKPVDIRIQACQHLTSKKPKFIIININKLS